LNADLQVLASGSKPRIPLLIVIGNEGGREFRFTSGVTHFPSQMALGAANSSDLVYRVANASARELRSMGFSAVTSPVLDVNDDPLNPVIGWRSFGDSPEKVAELGAAYIAGAQEGGIITIGKHFPGHGNTEVDSHNAVPVINRTYEQLASHEFVPFARAIQDQMPAVMVGHIANQRIDPQGLPASLSPALNAGLLREKLNFQGVTITDALTMGSISSIYYAEEVAMMAAGAGNDILMFTNPGDAMLAQKALMDAVENNRLPVKRIDDSVRRVLIMKARYGLFKPQAEQLVQVSLADDEALAREVAQKAIYAQGVSSWPLLKPGRTLLITPDVVSKGSKEGDHLSLLGELLTQHGMQVDEWIYPTSKPDEAVAMREQIIRDVPNYPLVIVATWDARLDASYRKNSMQEIMVDELYSSGVPVIFVALGSVYDLKLARPGQPAIATFGEIPYQIEALADALFASDPPPGVLPVQIK
jgi:beta-N-acetylhexosaminidase